MIIPKENTSDLEENIRFNGVKASGETYGKLTPGKY